MSCFTYIAHLAYGQYLFRPNQCMNDHKVMIPNSQPFIFINETILNSSVFLPSDRLQHYLIFSESCNDISFPQVLSVTVSGFLTHTSTCTYIYIYIYYLRSLKFTLKHLKCSYMFRSHAHPQGAYIVPC